jgi:hypothetical protein
MKTLLDYATPEELSSYRDAVAVKHAADADVTRIRASYYKTEADVQTQAWAEEKYTRLSARKAVGHDVVTTPPTGPTSKELKAQAAELSRMLKDAEEAAKLRKGDVRSAATKLLRTCADRCAEDYVAAAKTLGWCWSQLAAVDMPLGQKIGLGHWMRLMVPAAECFPAMKKDFNPAFEMPVLFSGDRLNAEVAALPGKIKQHAEELLSAWPL